MQVWYDTQVGTVQTAIETLEIRRVPGPSQIFGKEIEPDARGFRIWKWGLRMDSP